MSSQMMTAAAPLQNSSSSTLILPYGYQIDLDFIKYCENLANIDHTDAELQRRNRRRQRQSMEVMLGIQLEMQAQMNELTREMNERKAPEPPPRTHLHHMESPIVPKYRTNQIDTKWDPSLNEVVSDFEKTLERSKKGIQDGKLREIDTCIASPSSHHHNQKSLQNDQNQDCHLSIESIDGSSSTRSPNTPDNDSKKRLFDLEEQNKLIPLLQMQIQSLKDERKQLVQQLEATRASSSSSTSSQPPQMQHFQVQRISPVSLSSMKVNTSAMARRSVGVNTTVIYNRDIGIMSERTTHANASTITDFRLPCDVNDGGRLYSEKDLKKTVEMVHAKMRKTMVSVGIQHAEEKKIFRDVGIDVRASVKNASCATDEPHLMLSSVKTITIEPVEETSPSGSSLSLRDMSKAPITRNNMTQTTQGSVNHQSVQVNPVSTHKGTDSIDLIRTVNRASGTEMIYKKDQNSHTDDLIKVASVCVNTNAEPVVSKRTTGSNTEVRSVKSIGVNVEIDGSMVNLGSIEEFSKYDRKSRSKSPLDGKKSVSNQSLWSTTSMDYGKTTYESEKKPASYSEQSENIFKAIDQFSRSKDADTSSEQVIKLQASNEQFNKSQLREDYRNMSQELRDDENKRESSEDRSWEGSNRLIRSEKREDISESSPDRNLLEQSSPHHDNRSETSPDRQSRAKTTPDRYNRPHTSREGSLKSESSPERFPRLQQSTEYQTTPFSAFDTTSDYKYISNDSKSSYKPSFDPKSTTNNFKITTIESRNVFKTHSKPADTNKPHPEYEAKISHLKQPSTKFSLSALLKSDDDAKSSDQLSRLSVEKTIISSIEPSYKSHKNLAEQPSNGQNSKIPRPSPNLTRKYVRQDTFTVNTSPPESIKSPKVITNVSSVFEFRKTPERTTDVSECPVEKALKLTMSHHRSPSPPPVVQKSPDVNETEEVVEPLKSPTVESSSKMVMSPSIEYLDDDEDEDEDEYDEDEFNDEQLPSSMPMRPPPTSISTIRLVQEGRVRIKPTKEMIAALKVINDHLEKNPEPIESQINAAREIVACEWFQISSTEKANPDNVEDYLDFFEEQSWDLLTYMVNLPDKNGNMAMHYAVSHGNFDVVSILLDSKVCNINQTNNAGYTCIMLVSLAKLVIPEHRTVVQRLFKLADVNIRATKNSQTALMLAVSHGNVVMVQMMVEAGADINIQDDDGSTALMCAAEQGHLDIIKFLLAQPDCDSTKQDVDGNTALKISLEAGYHDIGCLLYAHEHLIRSRSGVKRTSSRKSSTSSLT